MCQQEKAISLEWTGQIMHAHAKEVVGNTADF